ncbi:MAG: Rrf2 family transcriptional regulator [Bacteroidetes bacterium]|nr:Rrf2 family transcriptional regulator [Bacteroidota bacterium]
MSASTKLSTAVKALCYLAESHPEPKSSASISNRIGVNASKLRKLLSMLTKNNIVESTQGISGGFILKKDPEILHLQEIYCAVEDRKAFHLDVNYTKGIEQGETAKFNNYFLDLFSEVQVEIEDKMSGITLGNILKNVGMNSSYKS